ncbi:MAG: DUF61 family protein [Candidatus Heimdallarchaeota archaeon]
MPKPETKTYLQGRDKFDATLAFLTNELGKLGQHLPKQRISLSVLLDSDSPGYRSRTDAFCHMRRQELIKIASLIPIDNYEKIRLPIIFLKEKNIFRLSGNKIEAWIIEKILGNPNPFPALLEIYIPKLTFYNYEFQRLRRELPTVTTFAIVRVG